MNNEKKEVFVNVANYNGVADISPIGTFVFCILCFAFWASDLGLTGEGSGLAIGFLGLAVFIPYLICGIKLTEKGLCLGGNTYLLFGAVFGACGGLFNTFSALFEHWNIPFNYSLVGIPFLLAGLYLIFMLPGVIKVSKIDFLIFLFGAMGVTGSGLSVLGIGGQALNLFNGWSLFADGVVGFYSVISVTLGSLGVNLPLGKPFIQPKESE